MSPIFMLVDIINRNTCIVTIMSRFRYDYARLRVELPSSAATRREQARADHCSDAPHGGSVTPGLMTPSQGSGVANFLLMRRSAALTTSCRSDGPLQVASSLRSTARSHLRRASK